MTTTFRRALLQWAFLATFGLLVLGGCVKTGSVVEQQPLAQKLPRTATVGVVVKVMNPEWQVDADHLKALSRISRLLREKATIDKLRTARDRKSLFAAMTEPVTSNAA